VQKIQFPSAALLQQDGDRGFNTNNFMVTDSYLKLWISDGLLVIKISKVLFALDNK